MYSMLETVISSENMDFERKIMNLQARLRAENEDHQRENPLGGSPSHGPGRRPKQRKYFPF